jgi:bifunctional UDP-N-acetylglucosamine pyrophosphorylase/glucosamine-1-phosphate N-acetyltransferase
MKTPVNIVILAAGLGTRMKSRQAKVLHRAGGKTLIGHVVDTALELTPPERIFVVVGHQGEEVQKAIGTPGVRFIEQAEQKGTGHAVMIGREALAGLDGYLVILYGADPLIRASTLKQLIETETSSGGAAGAILTAIMDDPTGYGRVIRNAQGGAERVVEQKAATPEQLAIREANMGLYCWRNDLFWKHVDELQPNNPAKEYYLTDMVEILARAGHPVLPMRIEDPSEVMGINDRIELAAVDRLFRDRKARELMLAGVTIEKPETVMIDVGVEIGIDTVVEPFTQILGKTKIGENCHIGAGCIIEDSELADEVAILPYTIMRKSRFERGSQAGPFARLRFDNHVAEGAQIGNFVELKKTSLGAGSKAMHLAYLGDSTVGADVNIGAGTITCNYDGVKKSATVIGDGAFIGTNSSLVAPVEIGAGAYTAAGSVITDAVPSGALAVGRARQVVKEGWAEHKRKSRQAKISSETPKTG